MIRLLTFNREASNKLRLETIENYSRHETVSNPIVMAAPADIYTIAADNKLTQYVIDGQYVQQINEWEQIIDSASRKNLDIKGILLADFDRLDERQFLHFINLKLNYPEKDIYLSIENDQDFVANADSGFKLGFDGVIFNDDTIPDVYIHELEKLITSENSRLTPEDKSSIDSYRSELNNIDQKLIQLLAQRMEISKSLAHIKSRGQVPILQPHRWKNLIETAQAAGNKLGVSEAFISQIFLFVHAESVKIQLEIIENLS
jgi:chorismate mutase